jgi:predicted DNA-binding protein (UPF0251 family)
VNRDAEDHGCRIIKDPSGAVTLRVRREGRITGPIGSRSFAQHAMCTLSRVPMMFSCPSSWRTSHSPMSAGIALLKRTANNFAASVFERSAPPVFGRTAQRWRITILMNRSDSKRVRRAIEDLPVHYRETLLLCEVEEMSYQEIAEVMSIPIGTVMSRLARARKEVRQSLRSAPNAPLSRELPHPIGVR